MFEAFFSLTRAPFPRDIPINELYASIAHEELQGRLEYASRNRLFAVVTGDVGTGKSTALRKFSAKLDSNRYKVLYISDSSLTPRNFYWEALHQMGCEPRFYRGDAKRQFQKELLNLIEVEHKLPVVVVDEAHLLSREMLEEIRFLLNSKMDSYNPLGLILVGQSELKETLRLQVYEAICQRINIRFHLSPMGQEETKSYITRHMEAAGAAQMLFTDSALDVVHEYSGGVARKINNLCIASLMHASGAKKRLIDDHMVRTVIESEFEW